jgi:hypothetical protein
LVKHSSSGFEIAPANVDILFRFPVTRREFDELRDLPDKEVIGDISFSAAGETAPLLTFENVRVQNSLGWDLRLNGKFNPLIPSIVFNFRIRDVGAICRVEVNGTVHGGETEATSTHWYRKTIRVGIYQQT